MKISTTRKFLREFFLKQMDRMLDLELLTQHGQSYWNIVGNSSNFFKTNEMLLLKIDLGEVWNSIPTHLKFVLEAYLNFCKRNITMSEMFKRTNKDPEIFWICLDYGCYLFFNNYQHKFEYLKEVQDENNLE